MIPCPGCGGRNPESATACDWCARPFRAPQPRLRITRTMVAALVALVLIMIAVGTVLVLTSSRSATTGPMPPALPAASPPAASPTAPTAGPVATLAPSVASEPRPRVAQVVNTGGQGAVMRREPTVNAATVAIVPEGAIVQLAGPEETVQAQTWRLAADPSGQPGWIRADFLSEIAPDTPRSPLP